jgi:hypothetical protein
VSGSPRHIAQRRPASTDKRCKVEAYVALLGRHLQQLPVAPQFSVSQALWVHNFYVGSSDAGKGRNEAIGARGEQRTDGAGGMADEDEKGGGHWRWASSVDPPLPRLRAGVYFSYQPKIIPLRAHRGMRNHYLVLRLEKKSCRWKNQHQLRIKEINRVRHFCV